MSEGGVHNLQSKQALNELIQSDKLVVIDCFATWCGPCKVVAPKIVEFSKRYPDAKFYKLDVDDVADAAAELGVRAMPTFYFFKNGEKLGEVVGANPPAIETAIKKYIEA
ncbi:putative thioredoxin [Trichodelitschia bisporula]|uniref:Thioredoxin n=1 Tax=Trichodelitschia bisporula TaxID=703511 RepID=A0A6G1HL10_9PEZI|nr:putative thioredoxin [Trichodelitschia bisporula]